MSPPSDPRHAIQNVIAQILQLHEELLAELEAEFSNIDVPQVGANFYIPQRKPRHTRWHSADYISVHASGSRLRQKLRHSLDGSRSGFISGPTKRCSPEAVAAVARIFNRFV